MDYASVLGGALSAKGLESEILTGEKPQTLFAQLAPGRSVILHYVNYGYQRRGCPRALVLNVAKWRTSTTARLITVFHELYAFGPPWRSSFWLRPTQGRLAKTLARVSDICVTTVPRYAKTLRSWVGAAKVLESAAFSTVGEPAAVKPLSSRSRRLVVFGSAGVRRRAYRESMALDNIRSSLDIQEIVDIGERPSDAVGQFGSLPVRALGALPATEVGSVLADSVAGLVSYPPELLGKSTIFAAYCAYGLVPFWAWPSVAGANPPRAYPGWNARAAIHEGAPTLQEIASRSKDWYDCHTVGRQAETMAGVLCRNRAST